MPPIYFLLQFEDLVLEDPEVLVNFVQVVDFDFEVVTPDELLRDPFTPQNFIPVEVATHEAQVLRVKSILTSSGNPLLQRGDWSLVETALRKLELKKLVLLLHNTILVDDFGFKFLILLL